MTKRYFSLEITDDNRLTKIFRIIFGLLCTGISLYWTAYNLRSEKSIGTQWITVAFLIAFGVFQIYAGLGFAVKFIELSSDRIRLKKNSVMPAIELYSYQIEKIDLFPLKVLFFLKNGKKVLLRFGIGDPDRVEDIKKEIIGFADTKSVTLNIRTEDILR